MSSVSVLILTLNEEVNIADCIASCHWCDDIVVFDSLSEDRTKAIALERGARVFERAFDNYAAQRNAALTTVSYAHPWVFMVDADERVPPELAEEVMAAVATADPDTAMFRMRRKDFFLGRWLRRSSGYPTWFGRLLRRGRTQVVRAINEEYVTDGKVGQLTRHLHHYPFNKGIRHWFERHNRYSDMEAQAKMAARNEAVPFRLLMGKDPALRRRAAKQLAYKLPLRPLAVFLYLYVARMGFLDGLAGLYFSLMRASYEMSIDLKVLELQRRARGQAV